VNPKYGTSMDFGAIVIGAGHNGLICASYLAKAGLSVLVVEARDSVGGCASTETFANGRVNICNCDHAMVRSMPIAEELNLAAHGLHYLDVDPAYLYNHWDGGAPWFLFNDVERTIESIGLSYPSEVDAYRRYLKVAMPVAKMVLDVAQDRPMPGAVFGKIARTLTNTVSALPAMLSWSKKSVGDVVRSFFTAEQLRGPVVTTGPSVWGLSPETPGTGLGALGYAMRHAVKIGRPVGGSGALPDALRTSLESFGGMVRTGSRVAAIMCDGNGVRGIRLASGEEIVAPIVVSTGDPRAALVDWLENPPAAASAIVARYRDAKPHDGYESKVDAIIDSSYDIPAVDAPMRTALGLSDADVLLPSMVVSKSLADMKADHAQQVAGFVADRPQFFVQLPSALDPTVASSLPSGHHVFSLEVLWTPYELAGGWSSSREPQRWLERVSDLVAMPDGRPFHDHVVSFRHMGPMEYEEQFSLVRGHAPSFAGTPLTALLGRDPEQTRYGTPVPGLFLSGAATFPGAGIWGASGRNAATAILASDGKSLRSRRSANNATN
jgi:phytoene dehydrogenase-like protein